MSAPTPEEKRIIEKGARAICLTDPPCDECVEPAEAVIAAVRDDLVAQAVEEARRDEREDYLCTLAGEQSMEAERLRRESHRLRSEADALDRKAAWHDERALWFNTAREAAFGGERDAS